MPDMQHHALLESELRALGDDLDRQLDERDLSIAVVRQLATPPVRPRRRLVLAFAVALLVGSAVAVPPAWSAIKRVFNIGVVRVHEDLPPNPIVPKIATSVPLPIGDATTLDAVRAGEFPVAIPTISAFQAPDEVWFDTDGGSAVSLVYHARADLPPADHTGVGLLIEEFVGDGQTSVDKYLASEVRARAVTIAGSHGVFLTGGDHYVFYSLPDGADAFENGRLAGNALIFERGPLTIRIEGDLPLQRMVEIAESLR